MYATEVHQRQKRNEPMEKTQRKKIRYNLQSTGENSWNVGVCRELEGVRELYNSFRLGFLMMVAYSGSRLARPRYRGKKKGEREGNSRTSASSIDLDHPRQGALHVSPLTAAHRTPAHRPSTCPVQKDVGNQLGSSLIV